MCSSPGAAFAWVGTILVNIGFVSLISWGAVTMWPLGFVLSAMYTVFLFWLAGFLGRKQEQEQERRSHMLDQDQITDTEEEEAQEHLHSEVVQTSDDAKVPVLISLLYGLAVISVGVTAFFLPVNLVPSCEDSSYRGPKWEWKTNTTSLPKGARRWAENPDTESRDTPSFGFIVDTDTTLFSGSSKDSDAACLWSIHASNSDSISHAPQSHDEFSFPRQFTSLSNKTLCFQSFKQNTPYRRERSFIYCSDGKDFRAATDPAQGYHSTAFDFLALDGILWFKEHPRQSQQETGLLIYSLEPESMLMTLHSQRIHNRPDDHGSSCNEENTVRERAIATFFSTALIVTAVSIFLWKKKQIPSMATTTYIGTCLMFMTLYTSIVPSFDIDSEPMKWWFSVTGAVWLLVLLCFSLSDSMASSDKGPTRWGLVTSGIAFMWGMITLLLFDSNDELWRWILLNVLAFTPLILVGAITNTVLLMFLGALGFLMDSWRFAMFVGDHVHSQASVPIQFLVFSFTGLLVGGIGRLLSKHQQAVKDWAMAARQRANAIFCGEEREQEPTDSSALLPPSTDMSMHSLL